MSQGGRLGLLLGLYFSQGLPFGFFVQGLPVLMREDGISLEAIGLSSLLAIPWAAKFLQLELFALIEMLVFVLILLVGWAYAWRKRDLEWG